MGGRGFSSDRNSARFGSSASGGDFKVEGYGKAEKTLARKLFGKNVSGDQIAVMTGATPFMKGGTVEIGIRDGQLQVDISHRAISKKDGMTRRIYRDNKGRLVIYNDAFYLNKSYQGKGIGTQSFASQAKAAQKEKVSHIRTFALRNDSKTDPSIGYRVWANLGYDGVLPVSVVNIIRGRNPLALPHQIPQTVQELYSKRGGKALWKEKGGSINMVFSLSQGSKSMKVLDAYLRGKK